MPFAGEAMVSLPSYVDVTPIDEAYAAGEGPSTGRSSTTRSDRLPAVLPGRPGSSRDQHRRHAGYSERHVLEHRSGDDVRGEQRHHE